MKTKQMLCYHKWKNKKVLWSPFPKTVCAKCGRVALKVK